MTPFYRFGNRPADVSWSAAFPQILWVMLTHYNLTDVVSAHWDGLQAYLGNLHAQLEGVGGNIGKMPGTYVWHSAAFACEVQHSHPGLLPLALSFAGMVTGSPLVV